jgi:hypothetical protein
LTPSKGTTDVDALIVLVAKEMLPVGALLLSMDEDAQDALAVAVALLVSTLETGGEDDGEGEDDGVYVCEFDDVGDSVIVVDADVDDDPVADGEAVIDGDSDVVTDGVSEDERDGVVDAPIDNVDVGASDEEGVMELLLVIEDETVGDAE